MNLEQIWNLIVKMEKKKYQKRGFYNTLLASTIFISVFIILHQIGSHIWPNYVQDKHLFIFYWSFFLHAVCQILYFFIYLPGYTGTIDKYEKYKINKKAKWPWNRQNWSEYKYNLIKNIIINQFIINPILVYFTSKSSKLRFENFPSLTQMVLQFLFLFFIDDLAFYFAHRLFHQIPILYKIHKVHHQYDKLFTFVAQYLHPLDYIINLIPSAIGIILLGDKVHCFIFFCWIIFKVYISLNNHCGYQVPWSPLVILPLIAGPQYHDYHHSHNVGNYAGTCYYLDFIFGTAKPYIKKQLYQQKKYT